MINGASQLGRGPSMKSDELGGALEPWRQASLKLANMEQLSSRRFLERQSEPIAKVRELIASWADVAKGFEASCFMTATSSIITKCPLPPPSVAVACPLASGEDRDLCFDRSDES